MTPEQALVAAQASVNTVEILSTLTLPLSIRQAGSGVTLNGDLTFSYQYQTKTLIYKGSNTWKVVG